MARVAFTGNLKRHVDCPAVDVPGASVRAVLENVFAGNALLRSYVFDDQDRLRRHVNVYVNEKRAEPDDPVGPRDEIFVFQSLAGG
ncbi:MAG: MoaD/ThiS family protein [Rhodospirillales bacterium]|nr:MoaD/ThiS family protein [Rhodospirillales bacterium]